MSDRQSTGNIYTTGEYYATVYGDHHDLSTSRKWMRNYLLGARKVFPGIKDHAKENVLEIGSGVGGFVTELSRLGFTDITASDMNRNIFSASQTIPHILLDIENGPLPANRYGLIFAFDVLEHISNTEKAICNIKNMLLDGGVFVFSVPYPANKHLFDRYHTNMQYPSYYTNLFHRAGFQLTGISTLSIMPFLWRLGFPVLIRGVLSSRLLISQTFFAFRKLP